jgi:hypothetical protein
MLICREEINAVGGYYVLRREQINGDSIFRFRPTKLSVHTRISVGGHRVYTCAYE